MKDTSIIYTAIKKSVMDEARRMLNQTLTEMRAKNSRVSIRGFAKRLNVDQSALSRYLKGELDVGLNCALLMIERSMLLSKGTYDENANLFLQIQANPSNAKAVVSIHKEKSKVKEPGPSNDDLYENGQMFVVSEKGSGSISFGQL